MSRSDLIADSLTVIRNAISRKKEVAQIPSSNLLKELVEILKQEGFISNVRYIESPVQGRLRVYLRYNSEGNSFISGIKRISKPGRRVYKKVEDIPKVLNGLGICILTTSKGLLTGQKAKELGVGGEVVCYVW